MREDHGVDEADTSGEGCGDDGGEGREEARCEEEGAELAFLEVEFDVEEVGDPGTETLLLIA